MIYKDIIQGTEEWHAVRCGKITASHLDDLFASATAAALKADPKAESKTRQNYRAKLVAERMGGQVIQNGFSSAAMERGTEMEKFARAAYEGAARVFVDQIGFADHPTIPLSGCSPDGFVGDRGLLEIKCPNTLTHIAYLRAGTVPSEYIKQMQWQMEVLGREWCDFASYDDRMPKSHRLFVRRLFRDEVFLKAARIEVIKFNEQIDAEIKAVLATTPFISG